MLIEWKTPIPVSENGLFRLIATRSKIPVVLHTKHPLGNPIPEELILGWLIKPVRTVDGIQFELLDPKKQFTKKASATLVLNGVNYKLGIAALIDTEGSNKGVVTSVDSFCLIKR